ncbi:NINE protein [Sphingomonas sp. PL-96]|uniref:TM2 domain-containing protein n=1 Tax=Sphingomonas sp. PL-96 TaxID=2887201 RepID=UPI001E2AC5D9|nr:NINE protein [Sphingomonas sp. PL-96]MCC2976229.1 NINE protein [Sphingomonas sp. PL-96]
MTGVLEEGSSGAWRTGADGSASKSVAITYAFWLCLGAFGAHRFYAEKRRSAVGQLLLTIACIAVPDVNIGAALLAAVMLWLLADAFLIPRWIRGYNQSAKPRATPAGSDRGGGADRDSSRWKRAPKPQATYVPAFGASSAGGPAPRPSQTAWAPPSTPAPTLAAAAAASPWDDEDDEDLNGDVERTVPLSFEYADADGIVTERTIINWIDTRYYVKGLCLNRHAVRTFRKDRVLIWTAGAETLRHQIRQI